MHREVVDLSILTETGNGRKVRNLWDRNQAALARRQLGLDKLDQFETNVVVKIPETVYSVAPSFFLGLFEGTLKKYGGYDRFFSKYKFSASSLVLQQIGHGAYRYYADDNAARPG